MGGWLLVDIFEDMVSQDSAGSDNPPSLPLVAPQMWLGSAISFGLGTKSLLPTASIFLVGVRGFPARCYRKGSAHAADPGESRGAGGRI